MKKFLLPILIFLSPLTAFAASHNYTCASWHLDGSASCLSDVLTFTTANEQDAVNDSRVGAEEYRIENGGLGGTWYISANVSGLSNRVVVFCGGETSCSNVDLTNGANVEVPLVVPVGNTESYIILYNRPVVGTFGSAVISNFCIDNDGSSCSPAVATSTVNRLAKFTTTTQTLGNSLFSDDGSNITLTAGNLFMQIGSMIDTIAGGTLNFGTTNATTLTFGRSGQNMIINSNVGIGTGTSTPSGPLSIQGVADFTTSTTTFTGNGGINLAQGCFAINGVCISGGTASSSGSGVSSIAQTYGTAQTGAITLATSSLAFNGLTVGQQITNSSGIFTFSPLLSGTLGVGGGGTGSTTLSGILLGNGSGVVKSLIIGSGLSFNGTTLSVATSTNCNSSASPAVCGSAPSGSVAMATGGSTLVVNTTAVTANSQIFVIEDSSLGTRLGITCNTGTNRNYSINARTAGTSFTIKSSANPATNKACLSYWIVN